MSAMNLKIDAGFGMPDILKNAIDAAIATGPKSRRPAPVYDASTASARAVHAKALLSDTLYEVLASCGEKGRDKAQISYVFDRASGPLSTPAVRVQDYAYASVPKTQRCVLTLQNKHAGVFKFTGEESRRAVQLHAESTNSTVAIGEGAEANHMLLVREGAEINGLLVSMWLIHLDVVAGAEPTVQKDRNVLRRLLTTQAVVDECENAKRVPGVRVHVNSMDEVGRALLVAACDRASIANLSTRVSRYEWPGVDLTLYGGVLPYDLDVALNAPTATVRAIVNFAERFASREHCGRALTTALWMYGTPTVPNQLEMNYGTARLHEAVHTPKERLGCVWHCQELVTVDLVALAKFVGVAINQAGSQMLRSVLHGLNERDTQDMDVTIRGNHESKLRAAGRLVQTQLLGKYFTHVSLAGLLARHQRSLWNTEGVSHALIMGIVVKNTALEEAIQPRRVPTAREVAVTDDPLAAKLAKQRGAELYLASQQLVDCGAGINQSIRALASDMPNNAQADHGVLIHMGSEVRLVVLGLMGSQSIGKMSKAGWALEPHAAAGPPPTVVEEGQALVEQRAETLPLRPKPVDLSKELLGMRGPRAPTQLMPGRPAPKNVTPPGPGSHDVDRVAASALDAFKPVVRNEWGPQPTSGEGLLCGLNALHNSLRDQRPTLGQINIDRATLHAALVTVLEETPDPAYADDPGTYIRHAERDFTAEQLAAVAAQVGVRLGVVDTDPGGTDRRAWIVPNGATGATVWVSNQRGHWNSVGPSANRFHVHDKSHW